MNLCPREIDHLLLHQVGLLSQDRLSRGVKLNAPESVALVSSVVMELIREGKHSVAELMSIGREILGRCDILPSVPNMIKEVQVEGTFPDGTKLVTIHSPFENETSDYKLAFLGSPHHRGRETSAVATADKVVKDEEKTHTDAETFPGQIFPCADKISLNAGRADTIVYLAVTNTGDRPIQVGSHYHFSETNPYLCFDRFLAYGKRLNIISGTSVRFEPGESKVVSLVGLGGKKNIVGGNNLFNTAGVGDKEVTQEYVAEVCSSKGFKHKPQLEDLSAGASKDELVVSRGNYISHFGPSKGDVVRLGDTELYVVVEKDYVTEGYGFGDELKFGGGKTVRDGMGQMSGVSVENEGDGVVELVITNALVIDHTGIFKADVGVKNGLIHGIGKAGNPDTMDGVSPDLVVGVNTEVISGEGLILTAGGLDVHVHFICPQLATEAIASGVTTLLGGGTGPATGTNATTCTPAPTHVKEMLQATDGMPLNFGFTGKGNTSMKEGLLEVIRAGAVGLKLHEDWGTTPSAIDCCLQVADSCDVQVTIHTDTLNESACAEHTLDAIAGRTIHTYHSEGAGGGHVSFLYSRESF